jgi:hypothetical protein
MLWNVSTWGLRNSTSCIVLSNDYQLHQKESLYIWFGTWSELQIQKGSIVFTDSHTKSEGLLHAFLVQMTC